MEFSKIITIAIVVISLLVAGLIVVLFWNILRTKKHKTNSTPVTPINPITPITPAIPVTYSDAVYTKSRFNTTDTKGGLLVHMFDNDAFNRCIKKDSITLQDMADCGANCSA